MNGNRIIAVFLLLMLPAAALLAQEVIFTTGGSLGSGDKTDASGNYEDVYRVRVEEGVLIEVLARSESMDTQINAILPDGSTVYNDDYQGYNAGFARIMPDSGQLELSVSSLFGDEEGQYELVVSELPPPREIVLDSEVQGTFGKPGGRSRRADRYILYGTADTRVMVELRSDDFDAFLEIEDNLGNQDYNDDGAGDLNSRLSFQFYEDGYAMITATSIDGESIGTYSLIVSGGAQNVIAEFTGELDPGDARAYDGTVYDVYEYEGVAGTTVSFLLESNDFDARVFLGNVDGSNLGSDDDSGGGSNSLLSVVLPETGTYRIYVTAFFDELGDYTLQILE